MTPSNASIMSIREIIDNAFGRVDVNVVNFKLIQTILYLLARQLQVLERRVIVNIGSASVTPVGRPGGSISVTEVKVFSRAPKKTGDVSPSSDEQLLPSKGKQRNDKSYRYKRSVQNKKAETKLNEDNGSKEPTEKDSKYFMDVHKDDYVDSRQNSALSGNVHSDKMSSEKAPFDEKSEEKSFASKSMKSITPKKVISGSSSVDSKKHKKKSLSIEKYMNLLEQIEEQREQVLRIIHQRTDSYEQGVHTPSPMASLDSTEIQYEKLLVVDRAPGNDGSRESVQMMSVVTQNEFDQLANQVVELQSQIALHSPELPENAQLLQEIRKGASLTDAMAALQLSARLEATEKALDKMAALITDVVQQFHTKNSTPGDLPKDDGLKPKVLFGAKNTTVMSVKTAATSHKSYQGFTGTASQLSTGSGAIAEQQEEISIVDSDSAKKSTQWVQHNELDAAMGELYESIFKTITTTANRVNANATNALKLASSLERKIEDSLNLGDRMNNLEQMVSTYAEQINSLDIGLSSQMTQYQEQLTQMQHDLEMGLDNLAEAFANQGGDTEAVSELNVQFTNLQLNLENAKGVQKELHNCQVDMLLDLKALRNEIEALKEVKSDRDEVADALRDKADVAELNGMVYIEQFNAVRGDLEKKICAAYDKFNSQESVWQKAIDDLNRELNDKAEWLQVCSLRNDINNNLELLRRKIMEMQEVLGEPRTAAVTRKLFRDSECLSCATPAYMSLEEERLPELPAFTKKRPPTLGAEATSKPREYGDHKLCYPGLPITHSRDPRAEICTRFCGGAHTTQPKTLRSALPNLLVKREVAPVTGSDGKTYMVDPRSISSQQLPTKPCKPCNLLNPIEDSNDRRDTDPEITAQDTIECGASLPQCSCAQPTAESLMPSDSASLRPYEYID